jgi:hypothetical protein
LTSVAFAQFNQELMMKWAAVSVIHYSVVGDYEGEDMVVRGGTNGLAHVTDHVEIGFDFDQTEAKLIGTPVIKDFPSTMGAIRNGADGCLPPTLSGTYEHSTIESLEPGLAGQLAMTVRTDYPAATMMLVCTSGKQAVDAHSEVQHEEFFVPGVMILAMPGEQSSDMTISEDGKSIVIKRHGWTYVYTPTPVR